LLVSRHGFEDRAAPLGGCLPPGMMAQCLDGRRSFRGFAFPSECPVAGNFHLIQSCRGFRVPYCFRKAPQGATVCGGAHDGGRRPVAGRRGLCEVRCGQHSIAPSGRGSNQPRRRFHSRAHARQGLVDVGLERSEVHQRTVSEAWIPRQGDRVLGEHAARLTGRSAGERLSGTR